MLLSQQLHPHPKNQGSPTVAGSLGRECSLPLCCMGAQCSNGVYFNSAFQGSKAIMYVVLLDVEKAFDTLPHSTIRARPGWVTNISSAKFMPCCTVSRIEERCGNTGSWGDPNGWNKFLPKGSPTAVENCPSEKKIPLENILSLACDNASVMFGECNSFPDPKT